MKKDDILPSVTTWMDIKGIILSEISQTEKDKYHMISLMCAIWKKGMNKHQTHKYREQTDGCQSEEIGDGNVDEVVMEVQASSYGMNNSWE